MRIHTFFDGLLLIDRVNFTPAQGAWVKALIGIH